MWLDALGIDIHFPLNKTKLVLLTKKHTSIITHMETTTKSLRVQKVVNFLGVRLGSSFLTLVGWLMVNFAGLTQEKRELLMWTS